MNKDEVNPILLNLFKETTWGLPWKQILQPKSVILLLRTVCGPALIVACRIKLCTQTWCCSSEMAKVPPNSSDANYAPISSHLQPRASSTAHPPSPHPESHLLALPAFAASSVCHQGVLRNWGCVCVSGRTVTDLILSHSHCQKLQSYRAPQAGSGGSCYQSPKTSTGSRSASWDMSSGKGWQTYSSAPCSY